jgi:hypothetical protein
MSENNTPTSGTNVIDFLLIYDKKQVVTGDVLRANVKEYQKDYFKGLSPFEIFQMQLLLEARKGRTNLHLLDYLYGYDFVNKNLDFVKNFCKENDIDFLQNSDGSYKFSWELKEE